MKTPTRLGGHHHRPVPFIGLGVHNDSIAVSLIAPADNLERVLNLVSFQKLMAAVACKPRRPRPTTKKQVCSDR